MAIVKQKYATKRILDKIKPGNVVRIKYDGQEGFYIVCKSSDQSIQTPAGRVLVVNLETGRALFKPLNLTVEIVTAVITTEDFKNG